MRLLLDTHILVWMFADDPKLPQAARELVLDYGNQLYCSAAAPWEIELKHEKRPGSILDAPLFLEYCKKAQVAIVPIAESHVAGLSRLPRLHGDPFDRIMMAQAHVEGMRFLTHDTRIRQYDLPFIMSV